MTDVEPPLNGQEVLDKIEADLDMENFARADQIQIAARAFHGVGDNANVECAEHEWLAFRFMWGGQDRKAKGEWFGPVAVFEDAAGNKIESPSKDAVTPAVLAYWRSRALASTNPHVQARMSDLLWELEARPDPTMAERAIRAYLDIAARHLQANDDSKILYITRHLERALILAGQMKNDALRAEAIQRHGETFDVIIAQKERPIAPCCDLLTSMLTEVKYINFLRHGSRLRRSWTSGSTTT